MAVKVWLHRLAGPPAAYDSITCRDYLRMDRYLDFCPGERIAVEAEQVVLGNAILEAAKDIELASNGR